MTVTVSFECGGCFEKAEGTTWLNRYEASRMGNWVSHATTNPQDVAPEGWIAFDPYTGCCYCPKCWAWIESDDPDKGDGPDDLKETSGG
jgi:hypothetical protein